MRQQWFEPTPALAMAGLFRPVIVHPAGRHGRVATLNAKSFPMSDDWIYAFLRRPEDVNDKPVVFACLADLTRHIHTARAGRMIQLEPRDVAWPADLEPREGVSIWLVADGARSGYLGWAYLNGQGREALQAALDAAQPDSGRIVRGPRRAA